MRTSGQSESCLSPLNRIKRVFSVSFARVGAPMARKSRNQKDLDFGSVHVLDGSPLSPCTATISTTGASSMAWPGLGCSSVRAMAAIISSLSVYREVNLRMIRRKVRLQLLR